MQQWHDIIFATRVTLK